VFNEYKFSGYYFCIKGAAGKAAGCRATYKQIRAYKEASAKVSIYRSFGAQIFHLLNSKGDDQSYQLL
jgi:hypothetical protein